MSDEIVARLRGSVCYVSTNSEWPNVLLQEAADLIERLQAEKAERGRLLAELYATVNGECPALLRDDSGGNAALEMAINDSLEKP